MVGRLPRLRLLPHHRRPGDGRLPLRLDRRVSVGNQRLRRRPRRRLRIPHHQMRPQPQLRRPARLPEFPPQFAQPLAGFRQRLNPRQMHIRLPPR